MSVQRYALPSGAVRYRARVKSHGREVAARVFERKADAVAWEQDQRRRLRLGEWIDPRRGRVTLSVVAAAGSVRAARSSAEPARVTRQHGGTTSSRVSATGRSRRSRRRKCRAGWAPSLLAGWRRRRRPVHWRRCGRSWRTRSLMVASSRTWRRPCASRPMVRSAAKGMRLRSPRLTRWRRRAGAATASGAGARAGRTAVGRTGRPPGQ